MLISTLSMLTILAVLPAVKVLRTPNIFCLVSKQALRDYGCFVSPPHNHQKRTRAEMHDSIVMQRIDQLQMMHNGYVETCVGMSHASGEVK